MRIRQLEAFRATVITGTMSAAAVSMRTSQPTVSRLLAQLEDELSVVLFHREKGRVQLTHEGHQFYRRVDEVFTAFSSLSAAAADLRADAFREIRIISSQAVSMTVVPEVMARLRRTFPEIKAQLRTVDINNYFNANCETESDVVLGNRIGFESQMEQIPLAEVDFVCVLPRGHRLADKEVILAQDLEGEEIISLLDDKHRMFLKHERVFADAGVSVVQNIHCHTSASAYALVHRGIGVALMEPFSAPIWESYGVVTRPFRPRLSYEYVAGLKPGARQSVAISRIIGIARDVFNEFNSDQNDV